MNKSKILSLVMIYLVITLSISLQVAAQAASEIETARTSYVKLSDINMNEFTDWDKLDTTDPTLYTMSDVDVFYRRAPQSVYERLDYNLVNFENENIKFELIVVNKIPGEKITQNIINKIPEDRLNELTPSQLTNNLHLIKDITKLSPESFKQAYKATYGNSPPVEISQGVTGVTVDPTGVINNNGILFNPAGRDDVISRVEIIVPEKGKTDIGNGFRIYDKDNNSLTVKGGIQNVNIDAVGNVKLTTNDNTDIDLVSTSTEIYVDQAGNVVRLDDKGHVRIGNLDVTSFNDPNTNMPTTISFKDGKYVFDGPAIVKYAAPVAEQIVNLKNLEGKLTMEIGVGGMLKSLMAEKAEGSIGNDKFSESFSAYYEGSDLKKVELGKNSWFESSKPHIGRWENLDDNKKMINIGKNELDEPGKEILNFRQQERIQQEQINELEDMRKRTTDTQELKDIDDKLTAAKKKLSDAQTVLNDLIEKNPNQVWVTDRTSGNQRVAIGNVRGHVGYTIFEGSTDKSLSTLLDPSGVAVYTDISFYHPDKDVDKIGVATKGLTCKFGDDQCYQGGDGKLYIKDGGKYRQISFIDGKMQLTDNYALDNSVMNLPAIQTVFGKKDGVVKFDINVNSVLLMSAMKTGNNNFGISFDLDNFRFLGAKHTLNLNADAIQGIAVEVAKAYPEGTPTQSTTFIGGVEVQNRVEAYQTNRKALRDRYAIALKTGVIAQEEYQKLVQEAGQEFIEAKDVTDKGLIDVTTSLQASEAANDIAKRLKDEIGDVAPDILKASDLASDERYEESISEYKKITSTANGEQFILAQDLLSGARIDRANQFSGEIKTNQLRETIAELEKAFQTYGDAASLRLRAGDAKVSLSQVTGAGMTDKQVIDLLEKSTNDYDIAIKNGNDQERLQAYQGMSNRFAAEGAYYDRLASQETDSKKKLQYEQDSSISYTSALNVLTDGYANGNLGASRNELLGSMIDLYHKRDNVDFTKMNSLDEVMKAIDEKTQLAINRLKQSGIELSQEQIDQAKNANIVNNIKEIMNANMRNDQKEKFLKDLINNNKLNPDLHNIYANFLRENKRHEEALAEYNEAERLLYEKVRQEDYTVDDLTAFNAKIGEIESAKGRSEYNSDVDFRDVIKRLENAYSYYENEKIRGLVTEIVQEEYNNGNLEGLEALEILKINEQRINELQEKGPLTDAEREELNQLVAVRDGIIITESLKAYNELVSKRGKDLTVDELAKLSTADLKAALKLATTPEQKQQINTVINKINGAKNQQQENENIRKQNELYNSAIEESNNLAKKYSSNNIPNSELAKLDTAKLQEAYDALPEGKQKDSVKQLLDDINKAKFEVKQEIIETEVVTISDVKPPTTIDDIQTQIVQKRLEIARISAGDVLTNAEMQQRLKLNQEIQELEKQKEEAQKQYIVWATRRGQQTVLSEINKVNERLKDQALSDDQREILEKQLKGLGFVLQYQGTLRTDKDGKLVNSNQFKNILEGLNKQYNDEDDRWFTTDEDILEDIELRKQVMYTLLSDYMVGLALSDNPADQKELEKLKRTAIRPEFIDQKENKAGYDATMANIDSMEYALSLSEIARNENLQGLDDNAKTALVNLNKLKNQIEDINQRIRTGKGAGLEEQLIVTKKQLAKQYSLLAGQYADPNSENYVKIEDLKLKNEFDLIMLKGNIVAMKEWDSGNQYKTYAYIDRNSAPVGSLSFFDKITSVGAVTSFKGLTTLGSAVGEVSDSSFNLALQSQRLEDVITLSEESGLTLEQVTSGQLTKDQIRKAYVDKYGEERAQIYLTNYRLNKFINSANLVKAEGLTDPDNLGKGIKNYNEDYFQESFADNILNVKSTVAAYVMSGVIAGMVKGSVGGAGLLGRGFTNVGGRLVAQEGSGVIPTMIRSAGYTVNTAGKGFEGIVKVTQYVSNSRINPFNLMNKAEEVTGQVLSKSSIGRGINSIISKGGVPGQALKSVRNIANHYTFEITGEEYLLPKAVGFVSPRAAEGLDTLESITGARRGRGNVLFSTTVATTQGPADYATVDFDIKGAIQNYQQRGMKVEVIADQKGTPALATEATPEIVASYGLINNIEAIKVTDTNGNVQIVALKGSNYDRNAVKFEESDVRMITEDGNPIYVGSITTETSGTLSIDNTNDVERIDNFKKEGTAVEGVTISTDQGNFRGYKITNNDNQDTILFSQSDMQRIRNSNINSITTMQRIEDDAGISVVPVEKKTVNIKSSIVASVSQTVNNVQENPRLKPLSDFHKDLKEGVVPQARDLFTWSGIKNVPNLFVSNTVASERIAEEISDVIIDPNINNVEGINELIQMGVVDDNLNVLVENEHIQKYVDDAKDDYFKNQLESVVRAEYINEIVKDTATVLSNMMKKDLSDDQIKELNERLDENKEKLNLILGVGPTNRILTSQDPIAELTNIIDTNKKYISDANKIVDDAVDDNKWDINNLRKTREQFVEDTKNELPNFFEQLRNIRLEREKKFAGQEADVAGEVRKAEDLLKEPTPQTALINTEILHGTTLIPLSKAIDQIVKTDEVAENIRYLNSFVINDVPHKVVPLKFDGDVSVDATKVYDEMNKKIPSWSSVSDGSISQLELMGFDSTINQAIQKYNLAIAYFQKGTEEGYQKAFEYLFGTESENGAIALAKQAYNDEFVKQDRGRADEFAKTYAQILMTGGVLAKYAGPLYAPYMEKVKEEISAGEEAPVAQEEIATQEQQAVEPEVILPIYDTEQQKISQSLSDIQNEGNLKQKEMANLLLNPYFTYKSTGISFPINVEQFLELSQKSQEELQTRLNQILESIEDENLRQEYKEAFIFLNEKIVDLQLTRMKEQRSNLPPATTTPLINQENGINNRKEALLASATTSAQRAAIIEDATNKKLSLINSWETADVLRPVVDTSSNLKTQVDNYYPYSVNTQISNLLNLKKSTKADTYDLYNYNAIDPVTGRARIIRETTVQEGTKYKNDVADALFVIESQGTFAKNLKITNYNFLLNNPLSSGWIPVLSGKPNIQNRLYVNPSNVQNGIDFFTEMIKRLDANGISYQGKIAADPKNIGARTDAIVFYFSDQDLVEVIKIAKELESQNPTFLNQQTNMFTKQIGKGLSLATQLDVWNKAKTSFGEQIEKSFDKVYKPSMSETKVITAMKTELQARGLNPEKPYLGINEQDKFDLELQKIEMESHVPELAPTPAATKPSITRRILTNPWVYVSTISGAAFGGPVGAAVGLGIYGAFHYANSAWQFIKSIPRRAFRATTASISASTTKVASGTKKVAVASINFIRNNPLRKNTCSDCSLLQNQVRNLLEQKRFDEARELLVKPMQNKITKYVELGGVEAEWYLASEDINHVQEAIDALDQAEYYVQTDDNIVGKEEILTETKALKNDLMILRDQLKQHILGRDISTEFENAAETGDFVAVNSLIAQRKMLEQLIEEDITDKHTAAPLGIQKGITNLFDSGKTSLTVIQIPMSSANKIGKDVADDLKALAIDHFKRKLEEAGITPPMPDIDAGSSLSVSGTRITIITENIDAVREALASFETEVVGELYNRYKDDYPQKAVDILSFKPTAGITEIDITADGTPTDFRQNDLPNKLNQRLELEAKVDALWNDYRKDVSKPDDLNTAVSRISSWLRLEYPQINTAQDIKDFRIASAQIFQAQVELEMLNKFEEYQNSRTNSEKEAYFQELLYNNLILSSARSEKVSKLGGIYEGELALDDYGAALIPIGVYQRPGYSEGDIARLGQEIGSLRVQNGDTIGIRGIENIVNEYNTGEMSITDAANAIQELQQTLDDKTKELIDISQKNPRYTKNYKEGFVHIGAQQVAQNHDGVKFSFIELDGANAFFKAYKPTISDSDYFTVMEIIHGTVNGVNGVDYVVSNAGDEISLITGNDLMTDEELKNTLDLIGKRIQDRFKTMQFQVLRKVQQKDGTYERVSVWDGDSPVMDTLKATITYDSQFVLNAQEIADDPSIVHDKIVMMDAANTVMKSITSDGEFIYKGQVMSVDDAVKYQGAQIAIKDVARIRAGTLDIEDVVKLGENDVHAGSDFVDERSENTVEVEDTFEEKAQGVVEQVLRKREDTIGMSIAQELKEKC